MDSHGPLSTPCMTRRGWADYNAVDPSGLRSSRAACGPLVKQRATELPAIVESPGSGLAVPVDTHPLAKPQVQMQCAALRGPMWSFRLP